MTTDNTQDIEELFLMVLVEKGGGAFEEDVIADMDNMDAFVEHYPIGKPIQPGWHRAFVRRLHPKINKRLGDEIIYWDTRKGVRTYYKINPRYIDRLKEEYGK